MSEKIFVESLDETYEHGFGVLIHKVIADYVFADLGISGSIEQIRVLVDIKKPFFAVFARLGSSPPPIKMEDYARLDELSDGVHIVISDETFAEDLLKSLWNRFGKDNVDQIDRWESVIPSESITMGELKDMIVAEPGERVQDLVMGAIRRIIPEGFRIGFLQHEDGEMTIIASEDPVQNDWIEEVENALSNPPKSLPREKIEGVKKKPRKLKREELEEWGTPWKVG